MLDKSKKRIKPCILHVITGLGDGGAESLLYNICKFEYKYKHIVISLSKEGKHFKLLKKEGIIVYHFSWNDYLLLKPINILFKIKEKYKPDIIQAWMYHACLFISLVRPIIGIDKKVVWNIHCSSLEEGLSITKLIRYLLKKMSRYSNNKIIYCSQTAKDYHKKLGFYDKNSIVIRNGYDIRKFNIKKVNNVNKITNKLIKDGSIIFGMVARYHPQKDHKNLIQALNIVNNECKNDIHCLLVGQGISNKNKELVNLINSYRVNDLISLVGPRNDIADIFNIIDIHILSSKFGESFPNVICESMACGTPCIATNVGDTKFIIGENGWVSTPGDQYDLARCIRLSMNEFSNKENWKTRREEARSRIIKNFTLKVMLKNFIVEWEKLLMNA